MNAQPLTPEGERIAGDLARRHGFSVEAVTHMMFAVLNGNGSMAQFSHPEFGGSGQWMRGGMLMLGDMFNYGLKNRVDGLCHDISGILASQPGLLSSGSFQSQSQGGNAWQTQAAGGAAKFVLIDKAGNVIADQDAAAAKRRDPALLLLVGQDAPQCAAALMAELQAQKTVFSRVVAAERIDGLRWNLTLRDGAVVKLPADDAPTALAQLAGLQSSMALLDRPVEWIDLRQPDKLVVHPYPAVGGHS